MPSADPSPAAPILLRSSVAAMLARLPGPASPTSPDGQRFATAFRHGSMSVELYAPLGHDPQTPHAQDELYVVVSGTGSFSCGHDNTAFGPGDVLFAPAGATHRFKNFSEDFVTWVIFHGPTGGESP